MPRNNTSAALSALFNPPLLDRLDSLSSATSKSLPRLIREAVSHYIARHGHLLDGVHGGGSGDAPLICSPLVLQPALLLQAKASILAHNHTNGLAIPLRAEHFMRLAPSEAGERTSDDRVGERDGKELSR